MVLGWVCFSLISCLLECSKEKKKKKNFPSLSEFIVFGVVEQVDAIHIQISPDKHIIIKFAYFDVV